MAVGVLLELRAGRVLLPPLIDGGQLVGGFLSGLLLRGRSRLFGCVGGRFARDGRHCSGVSEDCHLRGVVVRFPRAPWIPVGRVVACDDDARWQEGRSDIHALRRVDVAEQATVLVFLVLPVRERQGDGVALGQKSGDVGRGVVVTALPALGASMPMIRTVPALVPTVSPSVTETTTAAAAPGGAEGSPDEEVSCRSQRSQQLSRDGLSERDAGMSLLREG